MFTPGEAAAKARLAYYLEGSNAIASYKDTRNQLLGFDFSSKLSVWLAHGAISPRTIVKAIEQYEQRIVKNQSTYWLKFEILWREFFRHAMNRFKRKYFLLNGLSSQVYFFDNNAESLEQWKRGTTHSNFVNANMIELNQTGYMSNRGRQNVASYLIHDLKLDWRLGASYFESKLIDYDVSSNWCNWAYLAAVGNSTRKRVFNVVKQQKMYDPKNKYTDFWLNKYDEDI